MMSSSTTFLNAGAKIRVIAPARWLPPELELELFDLAAQFELKIDIDSRAYHRLHQFSGSDKERADSLFDSFIDPSVDCIWFARGGYGSARIYPYLDFSEMKKLIESKKIRKKIWMGYSDATALLLSAYQYDLALPIHGPMPIDLIKENGKHLIENLLSVLRSSPERLLADFLKNTGVVRTGLSSGNILGGNLTLICNYALWGDHKVFDNCILVLEDVEEYLYAIDRNIQNLVLGGILARCSGVILGDFVKTQDNDIPFGYTVEEIVAYHTRHYGIPIISGGQFGHGTRNLPFVFGEKLSFEAKEDGTVALLD